jgi:streptogramin lyase
MSRFPIRSTIALVACVTVAVAAVSASSAAAPAPGFPANHVFVGGYDAARSTAAVFEFDEAGAFVRKIYVPATVDGTEVYGVAFGPDGNLYCAVLSGEIVRVDPSLTATSVMGSAQGLSNTVGVTFGPDGRMYVCNRNFGGTMLVATTDGVVLSTYTAPTGYAPSYATIAPNGHVLVSLYNSSDKDGIAELDADLRPVETFGQGSFTNYPANVVFGRNGYMYVPDYGGNVVRVFDARRQEQDKLEPGTLSGPYGAALGADGTLLVANYDGNTVSVVSPVNGSEIRSLTHPDLEYAAGVAVAPARFSVKVSGSIASGAAKAVKVKNLPCVLSFSPGSGTIHLAAATSTEAIPLPMTFASSDQISSDGQTVGLHGSMVEAHGAARQVHSVALVATGELSEFGAFVPKTVSGTLHVSRPGTTGLLTIGAAKRLP